MVQRLDPESTDDLAAVGHSFDTVLCLNVLEYLDRPDELIDALRGALKSSGSLIVLVPNGPGLFGSLDHSLGHKRRFRSNDVRRLLDEHGFAVEKVYQFNKAGAPPWWAYSRLLGSRHISKPVLKLFDKTVWFWSRLEWLIPWPGLSLIAVARKKATGAETNDAAEYDASNARA
jgi:SAM-dependent methyltransferase